MSPRFSDAIFWIAVVSCAVAQLFILRAVFRVTPASGSAANRDKQGAPDSSITTAAPSIAELSGVPLPHRLTEIVWVVLPVVLLVLAFVGAWRVMHPAPPELPDFLRSGATVIGR